MIKRKKFEEYTEREFLEIVNKLSSDEILSAEKLDAIADHVVDASEHPFGSDVLFYPDPSEPDTPERVVEIFKKWRAENGKPGFKPA